MARPIKKGLEYFSHDVDASNDDKIESLEAVYGNDGYACYFKLLERIYRNGGFCHISDAETMQKYSKKCNISDVKRFEDIVNFMVRLQLFKKDPWNDLKMLTSGGIKKRVQVVKNKRDRMKKLYRENVSDGRNHAESPQSKVKERKAKETIAETPQKFYPQIDNLKNIDSEIKNFKTAGMDDIWIKNRYLELGVSEVEIDAAMGKKF